MRVDAAMESLSAAEWLKFKTMTAPKAGEDAEHLERLRVPGIQSNDVVQPGKLFHGTYQR